MKINIKNLNKKQTIILTIVITLFLVVILPFGIYSIVNSETPGQVLQDIFTPNAKQIVGKWQDEKGISGYEFFDDNTYDYHLSTYSYTKDYKINGNKITLMDYNSNATVIYKFSINGDKLKLTLVESNGKEPEDKEVAVFTKVENFNLKKPIDVIKEFAQEAKSENPDEKDKDSDKDKAKEESTAADEEAEDEESADEESDEELIDGDVAEEETEEEPAQGA